MKFALRQLARAPGFTALTLLTLALTIGATTAVFSIVRSVLLRPPAYADAGRIVVIRTAHAPELSDFNASPGDFLSWREGLASFESLGALAAQEFILTGTGEPQRVSGARATADVFSVFGLSPILGRAFGAADDRIEAEPVVVLSHAFWQQHLGGAATALGQRLRLDSRDFTIVGVMPPDFQREQPTAVWIPMAFSAEERSEGYRGARFLDVVGRLRPGVTAAAAQTELDLISERLGRDHPDFNRGWTATLTPWRDYTVREVRLVLWLLLAAVGCVLAVACSNLAGVVLARGVVRERELAVRSSLGATRGRLVRQLLTESLVLAVAGGLVGWLVAGWATDAMVALAPSSVIVTASAVLDPVVLLFVASLSLGAGLLLGVAPACRLSAMDVQTALKSQSGNTTAAPGQAWTRKLLAIAQLAAAVALLSCTALLVRSLFRLTSVDPGFNPASALAVQIDLPVTDYRQPDQQQAFAQRLLERVRSQPGIAAAGVAQALPLRSNWSIDFLIEGHPPAADGSQKVGFFAVSPDYFAAMGIRLQRGRTFAESDRAGSPSVVVVNEAFARRYFPNGDALGRRIYLMKGPWLLSEIVGIVADVKQTSLAQPAPPQAYEPFAQWPRPNFTLVVRTEGAAAVAVPSALRAAVTATDPQQPITSLMPLDALIAHSLAAQRFLALLLTVFAGVATAIAAIGVFGVMMQHVSLRTRELGIRLALGATPGQLVRSVLRQGLTLVVLGGALGAALATACMPVIRTMLFETKAADADVLAALVCALGLIALLACWLPARRATRIDPIEALRAD